MKFIFALLWASLSFSLMNAQEINTEKISDTLKEVVITAQYIPQDTRKSVYRVQTINLKEANKQAATNLRELLLQELDMDISQQSVFGAGVEIQGLSKENIKILIDGVPVIGRLNGIIDLNQINLNNISRVEIIEGPVSVFYGTDAMGGVINLISDKNQGSELRIYHESVNATQISGNVTGKLKEHTIKAGAGYYIFDGLSTSEEEVRNLNWEARKQFFGNIAWDTKINRVAFNYSGRFNQDILYSYGNPDRRGNIYDKNYFTIRQDNILKFHGKSSQKVFFNITASLLNYRRFHDTYQVNPVTFDKILLETDSREDNLVTYRYSGLKGHFSKSLGNNKMEYFLGFDVNNEYSTGKRILNTRQDITTSALFASFNYSVIPHFSFQPEIRFTYNNVYGMFTSPAFHIKWNVGDKSVFRFSYAKGFRSPSIKELFLDFNIQAGPFTYIIKGNKNLKPEHSNSYNLYYDTSFQIGQDFKMNIEPSVFYNEMENLITLSEMIDFQRQYLNIDNYKTLGGKMKIGLKNKTLSATAGWALTGRYNKYSEEYASDKFLFSSEITSSFSYLISKIDLTASVSYKYIGKRKGFYLNSDNDKIETTRKSFHMMDLYLQKSFFSKKLTFNSGIKNIFDTKDIETLYETGEAHQRNMQSWGRSVFVKITYRFF